MHKKTRRASTLARGPGNRRARAARVRGDGLREDPEPREHREAAVLQLLDLERVEILAEEVGLLAFGKVERVEPAAGEH